MGLGDGLVPKHESAAWWGSGECVHALQCPALPAPGPGGGMGPSECVRTLGRPVHLAAWPGGGVGLSELVCLLWRPELVFIVCMEVHLLLLVHCLLRLAASGPPRLDVCFGRRLLRRTVAAFSTFLLVCVVIVV